MAAAPRSPSSPRSTGARGSTTSAWLARRAVDAVDLRARRPVPGRRRAARGVQPLALPGRASRWRTHGSSPSSTRSAGPTWCARRRRGARRGGGVGSACSATSSATTRASCTARPAWCPSAAARRLARRAGRRAARSPRRTARALLLRARQRPRAAHGRPHRPPAAGAARRRAGFATVANLAFSGAPWRLRRHGSGRAPRAGRRAGARLTGQRPEVGSSDRRAMPRRRRQAHHASHAHARRSRHPPDAPPAARHGRAPSPGRTQDPALPAGARAAQRTMRSGAPLGTEHLRRMHD